MKTVKVDLVKTRSSVEPRDGRLALVLTEGDIEVVLWCDDPSAASRAVWALGFRLDQRAAEMRRLAAGFALRSR